MVRLMIDRLQAARNWIFDLDGTLTRPVHDFEHIRAELGLPSGADILAAIAITPEPDRSHLNQRLDQLEYFYAGQAQPASGVLSLLELLASQGCNMGILTRNKKAVAIHSLEAIGVGQFFKDKAVFGRDEAQAKPHPQGVRLLLDLWQAKPSEGVMVGDFRYDLEVGRAAGVATVHVDDRAGRDWPELTDLKVGSLEQLHQLLKR